VTVHDTYSKRRKRQLGNLPDVWEYEEFPENFRVQVVYLMQDALGSIEQIRKVRWVGRAYTSIVEALRRELGVMQLPTGKLPLGNIGEELAGFLRTAQDPDHFLDAVELIFQQAQAMDREAAQFDKNFHDPYRIAAAIAELNVRFGEHALGYKYDNGFLMRADSQVIHKEVVRPALKLLTSPAFAGAEEEFHEAFEHHRHGREKDALNWCLKALESTLKVICSQRNWPPHGQAKDLLNTIFANGLIEPLWQSEFAGLRSVLESGVPTARNKLGGHGQGADQIQVPGYLAAFVIHQTAAAILFLLEAHTQQP
jgi:hypothetical protein